MIPVVGTFVSLFGSMSFADFINGVFEAGIALFLWKGVLMLRVDKEVKGFYWPTVAWTTAWGVWNLFYYPHLGQWFSFGGGIAVVLVNITWLAHVAHYAVTYGGGSWRRFLFGGSDIDDWRRARARENQRK
jgi:hypothetical protein